MKSMEEVANNIVTEDLTKQYDNIIAILNEAKENNIPLDEGLFGALFGGIAGAAAGPAIMKGICKVLGVDEKGAFGNLLTSRVILTALGGYLGWKA